MARTGITCVLIVIPAVTKGFDATTNTFNTQFAEVSVGCEACHGPGGLHSENPAQFPVVSLGDPQVRLAVCGSCHSRRSQVAEGFVPGETAAGSL